MGQIESFSIGQLDAMKEMPVDSVKTLLKNIGKSVLTNASEEGATELANILFDTIFMKELSNYTQSVRVYMADGMNEAAAKKEAGAGALDQIGLAVLGGGIMGAAFGGVGSAAGAVRNQQAEADYFLQGLNGNADRVATEVTDNQDAFLQGFNAFGDNRVEGPQDLNYNDPEVQKIIQLDMERQNELISHPELALPEGEKDVSSNKLTGYLFNPDNPDGIAKGRAFESRLGYSINNWQDLQEEILSNANKYPATLKSQTAFGDLYEQKMILYGKNGTPANVIVGWILRPNGSLSMTTAYIKEV